MVAAGAGQGEPGGARAGGGGGSGAEPQRTGGAGERALLAGGIARLLKWLTKAKNRGHWCVMSSSGQSPRPSPPVRSVMCQYEQ